MKTRIINIWESIRHSFWFLPAVINLICFAIFTCIINLDKSTLEIIYKSFAWIYTGDVVGARIVLSTIAGSMISVTGVVFSITIVALTLASSQFGPRLLRNFMGSKTTQIVLGAFSGTFIYSLLVLRSIHSDASEFPGLFLSVTIAVCMTLVCLFLLIYFIHHVAESIQADKLISTIHVELENAIERVFPVEEDGRINNYTEFENDQLNEDKATKIAAIGNGYVQAIDKTRLMKLLCEKNLIIKLCYGPGDFVIEGSTLAFVWSDGVIDNEPDCEINKYMILGDQRTTEQDVEFIIMQIVEIAIRALSPGINDPYTAVSCIHNLSAALSKLAQRTFPSAYASDEMGKLRVINKTTTFSRLVDISFDQIRHYGQSDPIIITGLLKALSEIGKLIDNKKYALVLKNMAESVYMTPARPGFNEQDRIIIEEHYQRFLKVVRDKE